LAPLIFFGILGFMLSGLLQETLAPKFAKAAPEKRARQPLMVIGVETVVLMQRYDPNQHWFDFMRGAIFEPFPEPGTMPEQPTRNVRATKFARLPQQAARLYVFLKGVEQLCLPFPDRLKLGTSQIQALAHAGYPTWDKTPDGVVPTVTYNLTRKDEVLEWCQRNCTGFYTVARERARFQHAREYILARMLFGEN
jgi:hypothetical protein